MKILKKHIANLSFILAMLILCQGCKVYHRDGVTLPQAVESGKRAKIETNYNQNLRNNKIVYEDGQYFGVLKHKDQISQFPIIENNIIKVHLQDKTLSTILTIGIPVAAIVGLLVILMPSSDTIASWYVPDFQF